METKLTKRQIKGLKALARAERKFFPLQILVGINSEIVDQLVAMGLAECGECDARTREIFGYEMGYRLKRKGLSARI